MDSETSSLIIYSCMGWALALAVAINTSSELLLLSLQGLALFVQTAVIIISDNY